MRVPLAGLALAVVSAFVLAAPSSATRVTNIAALHHDGQTFLTWNTPTGTGWTYRIYVSAHPIYFLEDFWNASLVTTLGDSTWYDRRLSVLTGQTMSYRVDSLADPLQPNQALCVITPPATGQVYYCVTAQAPSNAEDRSFLIGGNTLLAPVDESPDAPRPVYQRTLPWHGYDVEVYTLFASTTATANFPVMANRQGMAFDCGIVRGGDGPADPLLVRPHQRGGSFLDAVGGTGYPREWRLTLDDPWLNWDGNSFWYGYHENYDVTSPVNNTVPTAGMVRDYTMQRIVYTLLWARRTFPIDTTRVYAQGYSMGGIGSVFLAMKRPDLFAAVCAVVGKFDFSFESEPFTSAAFNPGQPLRAAVDNLWGTVSTDLPTPDGQGVYQRLNDAVQADLLEGQGMPPLLAFNGRNDVITGWAEKVPFYKAMERNRLGGYFFWDTREHLSTVCSWDPMMDFRYLYRFRTDRSYPALSRCTADFDPGTGVPSRGDTVGTINGFVEWDTTLVDESDRWEVTLRMRDLHTRWQTFAAPESVFLDITPRRLQRFAVTAGKLYQWSIYRSSDGALVRQEIDQADSLGLVTLYWLKVYKGGTRAVLTEVTNTDGVPGGFGDVSRPAVALSRNPASGPVALDVRWPGSQEAQVDLLDLAGRRVRSLYHGQPLGPTRLQLDGAALANGVYFVEARQGRLSSTRRLTILH